MLHGNYKDVDAEKVEEYGSTGSQIRWLLSKERGAPNISFRIITIEEGGHIGLHEHPNEHEIFVLKGKAQVRTPDETIDLNEGDYLLLPENHGLHGFWNAGEGELEFICVIPNPE